MAEYTSLSAFVSISLLSLDLSVQFHPQIGLGGLDSQSDALRRIARSHYRALVANKGDCREAIETLGAAERVENAFLTEVAASLPLRSSRDFNRWWQAWATSIWTGEPKPVVEWWWFLSIARLVRETAASGDVSRFRALLPPEVHEAAREMVASTLRASDFLRGLRTELDRMTAWDREVLEFTSSEGAPLSLLTFLANLITYVSTATWWRSLRAALDKDEAESVQSLLTRLAIEQGCKLRTSPRSWPSTVRED